MENKTKFDNEGKVILSKIVSEVNRDTQKSNENIIEQYTEQQEDYLIRERLLNGPEGRYPSEKIFKKKLDILVAETCGNESIMIHMLKKKIIELEIESNESTKELIKELTDWCIKNDAEIVLCPKCNSNNIVPFRHKTWLHHCRDCRTNFDNDGIKEVSLTKEAMIKYGKQPLVKYE